MVNHDKTNGGRGRWVLRGQMALAIAGLCLSLVLPSAGKAGVLVPVTSKDPTATSRWALLHGAAILQRGKPENSIIILVPSVASVWDALHDGMILLPAANVGCATP